MVQADQINSFRRINRRVVVTVYDWLGTITIALIVLSLLLACFIRIVGVKGDSMLPSLKDGDMLLLSTRDSKYQRGDVIVVDRYTKTPLIKRVIAVGGDTIAIASDGTVSVNNKVLDEPYIQGHTSLNEFSGEEKVPQGYLFVMGDNRSVSNDSRYTEIGFISEKDVVGKAVVRVWPLKSISKV